MSFNKNQFKDLISKNIDVLGYYSPAAVTLLMGTCAKESLFGHFLRQHPTGPARGFFQMEPATMDDIYENYLKSRPLIDVRIFKICGVNGPDPEALEYNLSYQICMCRLHYRRIKERLPHAEDIPGMALYWKKHYNTHKGKGKISEFITNYGRYCV